VSPTGNPFAALPLIFFTGTTGIGLATARRFLDEGARVAVTGTNSAILSTQHARNSAAAS